MPMSDCCDSSSFSSVHTIRRFTATYIGKPTQKHFTPRKHLHQRTFAPALYTCAFYTTSSFTPEAEDFYTSRTLQNAIGNIHGNPRHSSTNKDENDAWRQRHPGMQKNPMENALSIWGSSSARPMTPWSDQELVIPCRFWTTEHSFWSPAISQKCVSCETSFKHGSGIVQKYCPCHETWHSSETKRLPRKVILFLFFSGL